MSWINPRTWLPGELVTAALLNEQLRDNLAALKDPPFGVYQADESSNYTTSSTTFVNVDAVNDADFKIAITLAVESDVLIGFSGSAGSDTGSARTAFDVTMDGTRIGGDDGLIAFTEGATVMGVHPVSLCVWKTDVPAGTHTFRLQWRVTTGNSTLYVGAGTSQLRDLHPQFWVREVS